VRAAGVPALLLTVPLEGRAFARLMAVSWEDEQALRRDLGRRDLALELVLAGDELLIELAGDVDEEAA
jgi:hypothetical protein